jgi:hypothetical protein
MYPDRQLLAALTLSSSSVRLAPSPDQEAQGVGRPGQQRPLAPVLCGCQLKGHNVSADDPQAPCDHFLGEPAMPPGSSRKGGARSEGSPEPPTRVLWERGAPDCEAGGLGGECRAQGDGGGKLEAGAARRGARNPAPVSASHEYARATSLPP